MKNLQFTAALYILTAITIAFPFSLRAEAGNGVSSSQTEGLSGNPSGEAFGSKKAPAFDKPAQKKKLFSYPSIHSVGFVKKRPVVFSGAIFKAKENKGMISRGDEVYVRERGEESLIIGRHYTVYRILKKIKDIRTNADIGFQHFLTGVVEITEKHPRFAMGRVIRSFRDIALNDLLMPYILRPEKIPVIKSVEGLEGKIIGAEDGAEIMGTYTVVFIDKGKQDGVMPGQQYNIFYEEKALLDHRRSEEQIRLPPVDFGRLIVLYAEQTVSTALITQSDKAIPVGTGIRSPVH